MGPKTRACCRLGRSPWWGGSPLRGVPARGVLHEAADLLSVSRAVVRSELEDNLQERPEDLSRVNEALERRDQGVPRKRRGPRN